MAWFDFFICLFFGFFGVHKFREKKIGMGLLYLFTIGLFGIGWLYDCFRYLMAAIKGERITPATPSTNIMRLPEDGSLPVVISNNVILTSGETCHYAKSATYLKVKNVVVGYSGGSRGVNIRIAKGMSYRVGANKAAPVRGNVEERFPGYLTITNKRIVFSAAKGSFDKKLSTLSSIMPFSDAVVFQFGNQEYSLETREGDYIYQIVARIVNNTE